MRDMRRSARPSRPGDGCRGAAGARTVRGAAQSPDGLAATVLTGAMANAQRAWRELPVGTVKINSVFGGAPAGSAHPRRGSGQGFGYGPELLDEMTVVKAEHIEV